jgi:hypothetical protein
MIPHCPQGESRRSRAVVDRTRTRHDSAIARQGSWQLSSCDFASWRRQRRSSTHRCRCLRGRSSTQTPGLATAWSSRCVGTRVPRHAVDHTRRPWAACTKWPARSTAQGSGPVGAPAAHRARLVAARGWPPPSAGLSQPLRAVPRHGHSQAVREAPRISGAGTHGRAGPRRAAARLRCGPAAP